jgi:polar amino acid transport system substrate-binding protein
VRRIALLVVLVLASACGSKINAAGDFHSVHRDTLTVVTGEIPLAGMWEGTPSHPTGGFEFELARALAKRLGLAHVKVVVVPFSRIVQGDLGGADLALSDITATPAREQVLDFSAPYLAATPAALVRAGQDVRDLKTAQTLQWIVGASTTLRDFLENTIRPSQQILLSSSQAETTEAVRSGRADAGLLDLPIAAAIAHQSNGALAVAGQFQSNDDLSAALPEGSPNTEAVSSAIRALKADGTLASLADTWLGLDIEGGTGAQNVPIIPTES